MSKQRVMVGGESRLAKLFSVLGVAGALNAVGLLKHFKQLDDTRIKSNDYSVAHRNVMVRTGGTVHGPAFLPDKKEEWAHGSRQVRRSALRILSFAQITARFPSESRRVRRTIARARGNRLYREAMAGLNEFGTFRFKESI